MPQKILIIEDSATSMKVLKHMTEKTGMEPVCASSLSETRQIIAHSLPEEYLCAVVDYTLPDAPDGEAVDVVIKAHIPTIVITGRLGDAVRQKVLNKNVVDYIPKENTQVYEYLSRLLLRLKINQKIGVLVVDDTKLGRLMMVALLQRHNFITYEADGAEKGLALLQQHSDIKLVITDQNMPGMSGLEMVVEIRKTHSKEDLGIIGISADPKSSLSARFIKSGANDYLSRPYCHEEFFCRIMQNIEHIENIEAIRRASNTDYLTGLPNRRYFFNKANATLSIESEHRAFAIIDLDHFKLVNDTYGHDCGDLILKEVGELLSIHFRDYFVARFGGEEFCVYMPKTKLTEAKQMLDAFRLEVSDTVVDFNEQKISCTLSIGLTNTFKGSIDSMLSQADENLYRAKENGRNRVECNND